MAETPSIVPNLSFRDGPEARDFLTSGFRLEVVLPQNDEAGGGFHEEPRDGNATICVGPADFPKRPPGIPLEVEDVTAYHAKAATTGAEIVFPAGKTGWGAEQYRAEHSNSEEWTFRTYQPLTVAPSGS